MAVIHDARQRTHYMFIKDGGFSSWPVGVQSYFDLVRHDVDNALA
jgi:hypothetical protein